MNAIFDIINDSFIACSAWYSQIIEGSGLLEAYIALIFLFLLIRFLIVPIFGRSRGSDRARSRKEDNSNE